MVRNDGIGKSSQAPPANAEQCNERVMMMINARFSRRAVIGSSLLGLFPDRAPAADVTTGNGAVPPDVAFADEDDHGRHLSDFASRPVVLNLWAT